ncbi:sensor histidine kinase [Pseudoduganella umbonata]|nr:HAMP domain-containing sensor histidine kinase [Pseudoduganella umbonata]MBB3219526.1 signal transduction histidine kinase [Pseudoduganella umbonata]
MNTEDNRAPSINALASAFSGLRELILEHWKLRVSTEIPTAVKLGEPLLMNMVPKLYDNIVEALSAESLRLTATMGTNLAISHGRERANMTDYKPPDLLHEFQIFREVIFSVARTEGLFLSKHDAEVIGCSIEEAARESISGFDEADREKSVGFIATLSHDLRNPLNVANASAQLIQLKSSDPGVVDLAKRVCRKIAEADGMIQTLLDAALAHEQMNLKLHLTSFDIMTLVEEICADLPVLGKHVSVLGERIIGHWCRDSMKRVLENLLTNAQKYGDSARPIKVQVQREDDSMLLSVHNEGVPIPKSEMERLFKRYQRLETTQVKGWGLGLPYVQNVAESHGGTVVVDSAAERGTTFTVTVPIDARPYVKQ